MSGVSSSRSNRLLLLKLFALVFSCFLALVFVELAIRIVRPQPASWYPVYREHPRLSMYSLMPNVKHHVATGETDWTIETDSNGYRFDGSADLAPGCGALWLGDSFAFGHGIDYDLSVIGLVDQASPGMRNFNTAVPGYGPVQYRQILEDALENKLPFDRVFVMSYLGNDFHDTQWDKDVVVKDGIIGNEGGLDSFLKRHLHLRRLLANVYHRLAPQEGVAFGQIADDLATPAAWTGEFLSKAEADYETEMRRIVEIARQRGLPVHGLLIPTRRAVAYQNSRRPDATPEAKALAAEAKAAGRDLMLPVEKARSIFERVGMPYFDATPILAQEPMEKIFFRFDGHLSERGNQLAAAAFLAEMNLDCTPQR